MAQKECNQHVAGDCSNNFLEDYLNTYSGFRLPFHLIVNQNVINSHSINSL